MEQTVIVRFGEIALKSEPVRKKFKKILIENINSQLRKETHEIREERGRIFINTQKPENVAKKVANTPGVVSTSPSLKTETSFKKITKVSQKLVKEKFDKTSKFAVRARRVGEHEFTSMDIEEKIGSALLQNNPTLSVDLDSPDYELHVEIRGDDAYISTETVAGVGGLPVGSQGKVVVFFESIESVVCSFLMLKRGLSVQPLFLSSGDGKTKERVFELGGKLLKFHSDIDVSILNIQPVLDWISEEIPERLNWIIYKRVSLRLGEKVANLFNGKGLVSDMTLGEISSVGLENLNIMRERTDMPVMFPLSGFSEKEIREIAEKKLDSKTLDKKQKFRFLGKNKKPEKEKIRKIEKEITENNLFESVLETLETEKLEE